MAINVTKNDATYLVYNYGKQTATILDKFDELMDENNERRLLKAEVWFTIHHEMTCTPSDFFMRRTGRLFFDKPSIDRNKQYLIDEFAKYFNWQNEDITKHSSELEKNIALATSFK